MNYWIVLDEEGAWLTTDQPSGAVEVVFETDNLYEAELALSRQISLCGD